MKEEGKDILEGTIVFFNSLVLPTPCLVKLQSKSKKIGKREVVALGDDKKCTA